MSIYERETKTSISLVEPSPWPAVGSAAGFTLVLGLMFMHEYVILVYILGAGVLMVQLQCFSGGEM